MPVTLVPNGDRILVRRSAKSNTSTGGIVLPDKAQKKPVEGLLLAKGHKVTMPADIGAKLFFGAYAGTEIMVDGDALLVMSEVEVMAYEVTK